MTVKPQQHPGPHHARVEYAGGPPLANLYIAIAEMFGVQLATFGDDGTGALPDLLAWARPRAGAGARRACAREHVPKNMLGKGPLAAPRCAQ